MKKCELRSKAARRIKWFELKESEIDRVIEMDSFRYNPDRDPSSGEPYGSILRYISELSDHKRHDLMCLMYLGRNIDYSGFDEETVDDFCFYAVEWGRKGRISNHLHGAMDPEYLAGKIRIGKWLKLAKDAIYPSQIIQTGSRE